MIGGGATLFVEGLVRLGTSVVGICGGIFLVIAGLYVHNKAEKYGG
jgi:hypothetical protein